ncbi:unnamed protein product [Closterium sp. NIES-54]
MQAEYSRLLASDEQPTPKKIADSIEHLVTNSRAAAWKLRRISEDNLREFRGLEHDADLTYLDIRVIEAVFNDDRDPASVRERAKAFVELAASGYHGVSVLAKNGDEIVATEPPRKDFRHYLMEFAHSEGWVLDRGFYNYVGAPGAREDFKHSKLPGRIPDKFQQASHIGGADGMGAGVLVHALGMMAWWEIPPREAAGSLLCTVQWHYCKFPWEAPTICDGPVVFRLVSQEYDDFKIDRDWCLNRDCSDERCPYVHP